MIYLTRTDYLATGIFGTLSNEDKTLFLATGEHAYPVTPEGASVSTTWAPKIPAGTYTAVRRVSPKFGYEVFWVQDVPNCTFIEIHTGSWPQVDSIGCILVGRSRVGDMISLSQLGFKDFMSYMNGVDSFPLTIS